MDIEDSRQRLHQITLSANNTRQQNAPSHEDQVRFNKLWKNARKAAEAGQPNEALECYKKAAKINDTEKIRRRIEKLEAYLKEYGSGDESEEDDDSGMVQVGKGFSVYKDVYNKMYPHQREAMLWFWRLHRKGKGGILGDDMGLGKTIQVIAYLSGLFDMDQVHSVLLILPVAVLINWEKEFEKWAPGIRVESFHSGSKRERLRTLAKVQRHGGVLMTSYGLVMTNWENFGKMEGAEFVWDYTILDEGHKIKNPSKTTKACHTLPSKHRFILSGTPMQNNLKEFWHLFDFVSQGTLLGTQKTFQMEYGGPITRAREKDATSSEKFLGDQMADSLRQLIAPYFLRRTKAEVLEKNKENRPEGIETDAGGKSNPEKVMSFPKLTRKNDFVVWCFLTEQQIKIYKDFLELDQVKELLMTSRSPLVELTVLKKLCDHLRLLSVRACMQLGMDTGSEIYDEEDDSQRTQSAADKIQHMSTQQLLAESGKLQFLMELLKMLTMEGHRTLIFSQSRKMLDIIEKLLRADNYKYLRMDGTVSKLDDRQQRINAWQTNRSYTIFMLTTQIGGVGLTLTGADRVVIFDPSWNPATDNQAVDRVYRIGQKETVVVYRLITCGSVEEKIYRRQIFKESITNQTVGCTAAAKNPYRYFSRGELKELFTLDNPRTSTTQVQLENMHAAQRKTDVDLDGHIAFLYSLDIFGISDHDLMFSKEAVVDHGADDLEEAENYIQQRVIRAQELLSAEADLKHKLNARLAESTGFPGSNRRHTLFTDRQQLLDEAARQGHEVELPKQRPKWNYREPLDKPSNGPSGVVDLDNYEDSFEQNISTNSSVQNISTNSSDQNISNHSSDRNISSRSFTGSNDQNISNHSFAGSNDKRVEKALNESYLQDVINNLSQDEIELNMRLLAEHKAAGQANTHEQRHPDNNEEPSMDESSVLEDVQLSSSLKDSSSEEIEVADQSMQAEAHQEVDSSLDESSVLEDIQLSSSSLRESSFEEIEVADQSMQAKADQDDSALEAESSMEEVEVNDQSLQASFAGTEDDDEGSADEMINVSMAEMSLHTAVNMSNADLAKANIANLSMEDLAKADIANLSMEDLAKADLDVSEDLDLHIPTPPRSVRKSFSAMASSPLILEKSQGPYSRQVPKTLKMASSTHSNADGASDLVAESPLAAMSVPSDEMETGKKRKSQEHLNTSDGKKYKEEEEIDSEDEMLVRPFSKKDRAMKLQDLGDEDDSFDNSSVFEQPTPDKEDVLVIQDSGEDSSEEEEEEADKSKTSEYGSYLTGTKKEPLHSVENDVAIKIPTPRETLQYRFDDISMEQSELGISTGLTDRSIERERLNQSEDNEEEIDLDADNTIDATSQSDEDLGDNENGEFDLENDATVDGCSLSDGEPVQDEQDSEHDAISHPSEENDNSSLLSNEVVKGVSKKESDYEESEEEDMVCNSEDSYEDEEEEEDEDEEDEDEENEDEDEYSQLVRQGEQHLRDGDEVEALKFFLQALKLDKTDKTLQLRTLKLYQKLQR